MIPLALEKAIIAYLEQPKDAGRFTQPYLIWFDLRDKFDVDEATIRAALEDMYRRKIVARRNYLYCLSEEAEALRADNFRHLEGKNTIRKYHKLQDGAEMFDRAWEGAESWTGADFE